ncbi:MAG: alpha/beta hydrolase [Nitriliruptoraceae bacterium]
MSDGSRHQRVATGEVVAGAEVVLDVAVLPPTSFGPRAVAASAGPSLLLLAGLGAQRTEWPSELLDELRGAGVQVITLDNRDAGHSTVLPGPRIEVEQLRAAQAGVPVEPPYPLVALARDALAVLDHLSLDRVHVLGRSMGGMVAQHLAALAPERIASLTILSSTSGASDVGQPTDAAEEVLAAPVPAGREEVIDAGVARARVTGSRELFDEGRVRARLAQRYDRSHRPDGTARQLLAILADEDRTSLLRGLDVPTLVIHGDEDPLVTPSGGRAVAAAVPGARFEEVAGMGHDLPVPLLPRIAALVLEQILATRS